MYLVIFEDGELGTMENIDESTYETVKGGLIDVVRFNGTTFEQWNGSNWDEIDKCNSCYTGYNMG